MNTSRINRALMVCLSLAPVIMMLIRRTFRSADDLERATNLQATLARLTGTDTFPSDDSESPDPETGTESPDLSPPRFLHHLAPDIEYDLDKSRKSRAVAEGDDDDPLDLFGKGPGAAGAVRKRMSNPLLGEPYYPNPNPVRGWTVERERQRREGRGLAVHSEVSGNRRGAFCVWDEALRLFFSLRRSVRMRRAMFLEWVRRLGHRRRRGGKSLDRRLGRLSCPRRIPSRPS